MLELVILAERSLAEAAPEDAAAVVPHAALTLDADSVLKRKRIYHLLLKVQFSWAKLNQRV